MHGIANKSFRVCRMPDRPSKLAHVDFARPYYAFSATPRLRSDNVGAQRHRRP
jgi:hypothetical protein